MKKKALMVLAALLVAGHSFWSNSNPTKRALPTGRVADFIMQRQQLLGIARRAEGQEHR